MQPIRLRDIAIGGLFAITVLPAFAMLWGLV